MRVTVEPQAKEGPVGFMLTLPLVADMERVHSGTLKFAITLLSLSMVTVQVVLVPEHAPDQPVNSYDAAGMGVRVTLLPQS